MTSEPLTGQEKLTQAKEALALPKILAICGSTQFMDAMAEADFTATAAGQIFVRPGCNLKEPHPLWATPPASPPSSSAWTTCTAPRSGSPTKSS